jgi:cell wall assembly regulator SMI1
MGLFSSPESQRSETREKTLRIRIHEPDRPATEEQVAALEARFEAKLPSAYREFLIEYNGGRPRPDRFKVTNTITGRTQDDVVAWFKSLDPESPECIHETLDILGERLAPGLVPFARDPGGNHLCLSLRKQDYGKVYFWDHECISDDEAEPNPTYPLADSFESFLAGLID